VYIELPREPGRKFGNPPLGAMAFVDERGNNGEDGLGRGHLVLAGDPHKFIDLNAIKMVPLKSERGCIRLGRNETGNVSDDWNSSRAAGTCEAALCDLTAPGILRSHRSNPEVAATIEA
jgi:hypothetical protein